MTDLGVTSSPGHCQDTAAATTPGSTAVLTSAGAPATPHWKSEWSLSFLRTYTRPRQTARSTNKQANEKVSDAQSHKRKYEGAHVTAGSYFRQTVSKGPFEEVMLLGATSYARIQEKPFQAREGARRSWRGQRW